MFEILKNLFGSSPKVDFAQLVKEGATILDVRTKGEFNGGHIKGSLNIPVENLSGNINKIKGKDKAIITCCASGARSASAKSILKHHGFTNVHNGGSWMSLRNKISK